MTSTDLVTGTDWEKHSNAARESGNVESYAKENGVSATRLSLYMAENGHLERMQLEAAAKNLVGLRHVINNKSKLAQGFNDVIEEIQKRIVVMIQTSDEDGNVDAEGIERLSKAVKVHIDSLLTLLGDPTTVQAVNIRIGGTDDEETSAHYQVLARLASKAEAQRRSDWERTVIDTSAIENEQDQPGSEGPDDAEQQDQPDDEVKKKHHRNPLKRR